MNRYVVVFQFLCSNCKCITVGKAECDANDPAEASHTLSDNPLTCRVCHQSVETTAVARTFVYKSQIPDSSLSAISPADPLT